jgi:signal transduction histidine kinase
MKMTKKRLRLRWFALASIGMTIAGMVLTFLKTDWNLQGLAALMAGVTALAGSFGLIWRSIKTESERPAVKPVGPIVIGVGLLIAVGLAPAPGLLERWLLVCCVGSVNFYLSQKSGVIFSGLLLAGLFGAFRIRPGFPLGDLGLELTLITLAMAIIKDLTAKSTGLQGELSLLRREVGQLTQTNVRLQNHAVQVKEVVISQERDRIAREFHDTLGHTLTGLAVKLQAAESLIGLDRERAAEEVRGSYTMVREALYEARLAVAALRDPTYKVLRGRALWTYLCETFSQCTKIEVRIDIEEDFSTVSDNCNAVVYRFIQEALTNAYRHGQADLIDVAVWYRGNELRVRVSDNGMGVRTLQEGFGLLGIRERVAELGGQVGWISEHGKGFDIAILIPFADGENHGKDQSAYC